MDPFRLALSGDVDVSRGIGGHRCKKIGLRFPVEDIGIGDAAAIGVETLEDRRRNHQLVGVAIGQRLEEKALHQAENRRVRPNAKAQCQECDRGKSRISRQQPHAVAQVFPQPFQSRKGSHFVHRLPEDKAVAKLAPCRVGSLFGRHAPAHEALGQQSQVLSHFLIEIAILSRLVKRAAELGGEDADAGDHGSSPARRSTRPMTPEMRSQLAVSRASCFRPLRVI